MDSFAAGYTELETTFRRLAEEDNTTYLPNPAPHGPVDFIFIAMEPSMGRWARSAEDTKHWVSHGFRNFLLSIDDFILHYSIRRFLCRAGRAYHITDVSKGPMFVRQARHNRWARWDRWYASLVQEIALVGKPDATILALGEEVALFLRRKGFNSLNGTTLHPSGNAAAYRKRAVEGREAEFTRFAASVTIDDIVKVAEDATIEARFPEWMRQQILGRLLNRDLSLSQKQLLFTYEVYFEAFRKPPESKPN